jgi:pectin methylesterase-like acyl-CoA thioesterase
MSQCLSGPPQLAATFAAVLFSTFTSLAHAETTRYSACQATTDNPLEGCPANTILVSQNKSSFSFNNIQDAISSVPENGNSYTILVLPGKYTEQLNVTRSAPFAILGQRKTPDQ